MKDGSYYEGDFSHGEIEGNGKRFWAKTGRLIGVCMDRLDTQTHHIL